MLLELPSQTCSARLSIKPDSSWEMTTRHCHLVCIIATATTKAVHSSEPLVSSWCTSPQSVDLYEFYFELKCGRVPPAYLHNSHTQPDPQNQQVEPVQGSASHPDCVFYQLAGLCIKLHDNCLLVSTFKHRQTQLSVLVNLDYRQAHGSPKHQHERWG